MEQEEFPTVQLVMDILLKEWKRRIRGKAWVDFQGYFVSIS